MCILVLAMLIVAFSNNFVPDFVVAVSKNRIFSAKNVIFEKCVEAMKTD